MSIGIIHLLKMIDIRDPDTEYVLWIFHRVFLEAFHHGTAVWKLCQRICICLPLQLFIVQKKVELFFLNVGIS